MLNARTKAKLEARIHERAAHCVEFELNDPRAAFITITRVELSTDLSSARVFYSVCGTQGDKRRAASMLADASGFIRKQLGRVLETRRLPQLGWIYDDSIERSAKLERVIAQALQHDREVNPAAHSERADAGALESDSSAEEELDQEYTDFLEAQEEEDGRSAP